MEEAIATALIAGAPDVTLLLDRAGRIVHANPAARRLLGEGIEGQEWLDLLDDFSREKGITLLARSWAAGSVTDWELDHLGSSGAPVLLSYTTYLLPGAEPPLLAAIGRDQTVKLELTAQLAATNQQLEGALLTLERTHAELKQTQAQLVQSEKMRTLGQLVAGVAHEINNPAAFIANNLAHLATLVPGIVALFTAYQPLRERADALRRAEIETVENTVEVEYLWNDLANLVAESQDGIERIRNIVLSLRNFARLDEAELKAADINEGLHSTLALIRPQCKDRIQISESYGSLPVIMCHPGQLNQVFLNLLTNAVQAIEGEGRIWVMSACQDDRINVIIRDSGKGMDTSTLARLGEPFFTTKPVGAGTGLGLAVSLGIIGRHQGQIRFASQPGSGTTVTVELPVVR